MRSFIDIAAVALLIVGICSCDSDSAPTPPPPTGGGDGAKGGAPAAGAPAAGTPAPEATPSGSPTATIQGKTLFKGEYKRAVINPAADPNCATVNPNGILEESIVHGDDGTLENVFIYVKNAPASPPPAESVVIDQNGCVYKPHVMGIVAGQKFEIRNSDKSNHNINVVARINKGFNVNQTPGQAPISRSDFKREEGPIDVKCNVHPWMNAKIFVRPNHCFAATGKGGTFTLPKLAPGKYTVVAWHEKLGEQTQEVTMADGESKSIEFTFEKK